jgi:hypothetical protein
LATSHTQGKEDLLRENGWVNIASILCESTPAAEIKRLLQAAATSDGTVPCGWCHDAGVSGPNEGPLGIIV